MSQDSHIGCVARFMTRGNARTSVRSVASLTRWRTATPYTQKRYLNIGVNPQGRETVKQEEEIGQERKE